MSPRILLAGAIILIVCAAAAALLWRAPPRDPQADIAESPPPRAADRPGTPSEADEPPVREIAAAPQDKQKELADQLAAADQSKPTSEDRPRVKPLLEGWPAPAVALLLSGEMHGYIEPCGCSLHQLGGLSH